MEREMDNHWKQLAEERMTEIHRARAIIDQLKQEKELQLQEINALTNERNRAYDRLKKLEGPRPNDLVESPSPPPPSRKERKMLLNFTRGSVKNC
jgi:hypothetical protein